MKELDPKFRPKNPARKHHYLPIFFLKGFTDHNGLFCVYDKLKKEFHKNQNPENWFLVKHLNSYRPNGEFLFTLEEPYHTEIDSQSAPSFKNIRESDGNQDIDIQDKVQIILFLTMLYWRSPYSDEIFRKLIKTEGLTSNYFSYFVDESGKSTLDIDMDRVQHEILHNVENLRLFK